MSLKLKSSTALLLVLLLLIPVVFLYACGNDTLQAEGEQTTEGRKWLDSAPERDFGGFTFRMFTEEGRAIMDMYIAEETGEPVDDAVWLRNKLVEERFNINIAPVWYSWDWGTVTPGETSILAGDDAFDITLSHGRVAYMYVGKHLVSDWIANMPYVDLSRSWWNQDIVEETSFFGRLYAVSGDITYTMLRQTLCVYFNKRLFNDLDIPYPYNDVKNGSWTLDKFINLIREGTAELNGDGVMTFGEDRFGFAMWNQWCFPTAALYFGGDKIIKKDENGYPVLALYSQRTINIFEKLFDILDNNFAFCPDGANTPSLPVFMSGLALFHDAGMGGAVLLREMEDDIGIIPYPKYDETPPRYYSFVDANAQMATLPITAQDTERISIILEAMASEGQRTIMPAYYELTLKDKHARDDESYDMLDIIKASIVVDWGYLNTDLLWPLSNVGACFIPRSNLNFTTFYEQNESAVTMRLRQFIDENDF